VDVICHRLWAVWKWFSSLKKSTSLLIGFGLAEWFMPCRTICPRRVRKRRNHLHPLLLPIHREAWYSHPWGFHLLLKWKRMWIFLYLLQGLIKKWTPIPKFCNILWLISWGFLQRQLCKHQLFCKYSTVDCKYLVFLQDFFSRLKPKQYKKCPYSWLFKNPIWKLIKKVNIYNQQLNFWLNNWSLHNWHSRKPQLINPKTLQNFGIGTPFWS